MTTFVRLHPGDEDPDGLLDPERQKSEPWDGGAHGRCDKCAGTGRTQHECESCKSEVDENCPACGGRVTYEGECPACEGSGEITDQQREGVSVFPDEDGLYRYMLKRGGELDGCVVVELEGTPSEDEDFDADEGALLIRPTRVLARREIDRERLERARRELQQAA